MKSVTSELKCTRCGYDLRTLSISGRCPECGLRIKHSLRKVHDKTPPTQIFVLMLGLAVLCSVFFGPVRINPGGPFLSIFGDIVPLALNTLVTVWAAFTLHKYSWPRQLTHVVICYFATLSIALILLNIINFWMWPTARGVFLAP